MSENIPTPLPAESDHVMGDSSIPSGSDPKVVPIALPVPKKSPVLLFIALIVLAVVSALAIYLFLQVRNLTLETTATPTPLPTPVASVDPTADWQKFSDPKLGFSFNYPSDWELTTEVTDVVELMKDHARIVITYRFDALGGSSINLEGSSYELDGLKLYKYKLERDNQVEWGISDSLVENSDIFRYREKPYSIVLRYPSRENGEPYIAEFDQILSTFKFTGKINSNGDNVYTSKNYGFSFTYPSQYIVEERVDGFFVIKSSGDQVAQSGISIEARLNSPYDSMENAKKWINDNFDISESKKLGKWEIFEGVGKKEMLVGVTSQFAITPYKHGVLTVVTSFDQVEYKKIFDSILNSFVFTN